MGLFDFLSSKKDSGKDAGNPFNLPADQAEQAQGELAKFLNYSGSQDAINGVQGSRTATNEVMSNPILGQLYGQNGTLGRTAGEEQDLASRGFSLKPEDYEAYGQASDQLARQFGAQEGGLAQALSARGLSSSGSANTAFSGLQGNKLEQLGKMQRQIANDRMNMNLQRLGQTRGFLSQLGGQAQNAIQSQYGRQLAGEQQNFNEAEGKNQAAAQRLGAMAGQSNENLSQRQQTAQPEMWASALQGVGNEGEKVGLAALGGGFAGGAGAAGGAAGAAGPVAGNTGAFSGVAAKKGATPDDWYSYMSSK